MNRFFLSILILVLLGGCSSLPKDYERTISAALADPQNTQVARVFADELAAHPGESGFLLLDSSKRAFLARNAMAGTAEKTLDIQYYIWDVDTTGKILVERIVRAANRGVRVRLLLDDITTSDDFSIALVDSHPNIEVRLFNPVGNRSFKKLGFIADLNRVNHRMHNKTFIMDNAVAVVGGRNIGDHYFGVDTVYNFRDLDVLAVGPIVRDVSESFDQFWNHERAVPISVLARSLPSEAQVQEAWQELQAWMADLQGFPYKFDRTEEQMIRRLQALRGEFVWARAKVLYDEPDKAASTGETILPRLRQLDENLNRELLIESAYFVPGGDAVAGLGRLRERGVRVRILTNSLASNDVAVAHGGYVRYRRALLENDIELYELRGDAGSTRKYWSMLAGDSKAGLHTKAIVLDREIVFIGSLNLDPRSRFINTEIGIVVFSPVLAEQVAAFMDTGVEPDNSYRMELVWDEAWKEHVLVWITQDEQGNEVRYRTEPEVGMGRRLSTWFMSMLPIQSQL